MTFGTDDRALPLVAAVAAMALIPGAVMEWAAGEPVAASSLAHFAFVLAGALAAGLASAILTIAGARRRDGRTVLLGTAASTMTALLAVRGARERRKVAPIGAVTGVDGG